VTPNRAPAMNANGGESPTSYGYSIQQLTTATGSPHQVQNPSQEDIRSPVASTSASSSVTLADGTALPSRGSAASSTTLPSHPMHRNSSVSSTDSYGNRRSAPSSVTSLQEGTSSPSYDSYTASPAAAYPPNAPSQQQASSSHSTGMYATSPGGSSINFSSSSSPGDAYTDITAAAILAAASHRRASPGNESNGNGTRNGVISPSHTYEGSHSALAMGAYDMPSETRGDTRKPKAP
jgi:hypothetical protein